MKQFLNDFSISAATAGFVAMLVGLSSTIALVFQAAQAVGATPAQISSWIWALGVGMSVCCIVPSLWLRKPVMVAWSTPGAAVLVVAACGGAFDLPQAVGAFMVCALAILVFGLTGWFELLMRRIPLALANALLAGVLAKFGMNAFMAAQTELALVLSMFAAYLIGRCVWPRYAVPSMLLVGVLVAWGLGHVSQSPVSWRLTEPEWVSPHFTWSAIMSMGLPLFVVTMASQNMPGVAAIRSAGYDLPVSKLVAMTGGVTLLLAPLGAFALSLSAITASICMSQQSHENPSRRYVASTLCGVFYLLMGLFGTAVVGLLSLFPKELIAAIAGLALLGSIGNGLSVAMQELEHREPALMTFLVTLSGMSLGGIGSAFWGILAGVLAMVVQRFWFTQRYQ